MQFNVSSHKIILLGPLLALVSLACLLSGVQPSDPVFIPPDGGSIWTATPNLEATLLALAASPTPLPISPTPTPTTPPPTITPTPLPKASDYILYRTQAGDTLPVIAIRFGVQIGDIISPDPLPEKALLPPNQLLTIPKALGNTTLPQLVIPDSEVVFSPSAIDFDIYTFVKSAAGCLSEYQEYLASTGTTSGANVVKRVALENSINPRLLLALLEYQSGWVYGDCGDMVHQDYPMGKIDINRKGLFKQLVWAVNQLSLGYYGWREGLLTEIQFSDGVTARLAPELNAGTVALQYYLARLYDTPSWVLALDLTQGVPGRLEQMFGNPWLRALDAEPLFPPGLEQPKLSLPFQIGVLWSYTGGPHAAWEHDGARAALDFAPGGTESGCVDTLAWAVASAPGMVVRLAKGVAVLDLDGDGHEQTGWVLLYLHLTNIQVDVGDWVEAGDFIGHPSCEGGVATGTHIHIARKYNGEWVPADGPLPFVLSGWTAHAGFDLYIGTLTRNGETVNSSIYGAFESRITRNREDP